jgi:hypothetical protein
MKGINPSMGFDFDAIMFLFLGPAATGPSF